MLKIKNVFWPVFIILLIALVIYLLLVPIILLVDTNSNEYYLRLWGLAKANLEFDEKKLLRICLKVFFLRFYFYPFLSGKSKKKKRTIRKEQKRSLSKKNIGKSLRVLQTFKVKRFFIDMDTGNCISNAKLYPVFAFLNYHIGHFNINFEGRNELALHIQNRPIFIIKSLINP